MQFKQFLCSEKLEPTNGCQSVLLWALVVVREDVLFHQIHFSTRPLAPVEGSPTLCRKDLGGPVVAA